MTDKGLYYNLDQSFSPTIALKMARMMEEKVFTKRTEFLTMFLCNRAKTNTWAGEAIETLGAIHCWETITGEKEVD